jgi:Flp pilus assembly protein TadD
VTNLAEQPQDAPQVQTNKVFKTGLVLLQSDNINEAIVAFEHALKLTPADPFCLSYLGLSMAMLRRRVREAVSFCEKAVEMESYHPELYHNLGRVYLMSGNRKRGRDMLLKGLKVDPKNEDIQETLRSIGVRKPPPISFLDRDHPVNVTLGKTLAKLRLR